MDVKSIGVFLKTKRQEKGITQLELSKVLGVTHQAVSRWETGESIPDVIILERLAVFYNITIDEIVREESNTPNQFRKKNDLTLFAVLSYIGYIGTIIFTYLSFFDLDRFLWILVMSILLVGSSLIYVIPYSRLSEKYYDDFNSFKNVILGGFIAFALIVLMSFHQLNNYFLDGYADYFYILYPGMVFFVLFINYTLGHYVNNRKNDVYVSLVEFIKTRLNERKLTSFVFLLSFSLFIGALVIYFPLSKIDDNNLLFSIFPIISMILVIIAFFIKIEKISVIFFTGIIVNIFIYFYTYRLFGTYDYDYQESLRTLLLPLGIISAVAGNIPTLIGLVYIIYKLVKKEVVSFSLLGLMLYNFTLFTYRGFTQTYIDTVYYNGEWTSTLFYMNFSESETIIYILVILSVFYMIVKIRPFIFKAKLVELSSGKIT